MAFLGVVPVSKFKLSKKTDHSCRTQLTVQGLKAARAYLLIGEIECRHSAIPFLEPGQRVLHLYPQLTRMSRRKPQEPVVGGEEQLGAAAFRAGQV